jgi:hypothetical protein
MGGSVLGVLGKGMKFALPKLINCVPATAKNKSAKMSASANAVLFIKHQRLRFLK